MKRFIAAGLVALLAVGTFAGSADAQSRRHRHGGTTVIESGGGVDANTLALLAMSGGLTGGSGAAALLPFLLAQPTQTTVIERRGRRWR